MATRGFMQLNSLLHSFWNQWCFLQSDWLKIVRLIPKSHHFECDYKLIALSPKIQSNERTELKQLISFKFRNTKKHKIKLFSRQVVFPKVNFYTKLLDLNLYSNTVNIQINKQNWQTTKCKRNKTKYYRINLEIIMKEKDFPTKNCIEVRRKSHN